MTDEIEVDLGVRCMHVVLTNRMVLWNEQWNMLKIDRGVLVVGRAEGEGMTNVAAFGPNRWVEAYEAWSKGDHMMEADMEGAY